jgi:hypothetical protein
LLLTITVLSFLFKILPSNFISEILKLYSIYTYCKLASVLLSSRIEYSNIFQNNK